MPCGLLGYSRYQSWSVNNSQPTSTIRKSEPNFCRDYTDITPGQKFKDVIDKQELYERVVSYCRATDRHDWTMIRGLYHEDAIDDQGSLFYGTRDEFLAFCPGPSRTSMPPPTTSPHILREKPRPAIFW